MDISSPLHSIPSYAAAPRPSLRVLLLIAAAHVGVLAVLVSLQVVPLPVSIATLTVDILTPTMPTPPPDIVPPKPEPPKVKPKTVQPRPTPEPVQQPILAVETAAPAAAEVPIAPPAPPEPVIVAPPPAPPAVSQPRFDADYLSNPIPAYPPISRRLGEEGKVLLRVRVEPNGRPSQVEVRTTSGSPRLDQSALEAVSRWRFIPAKRGDEPIADWVLVPIVFNLKN
ncbi:MAG: energy transducer TonB [Rhodocyclaceae bacterium]|nr:energy transducer TonB [Rhodocyclaceae bacterium]